eukprot:1029421-Prymnesium_polylepis.3
MERFRVALVACSLQLACRGAPAAVARSRLPAHSLAPSPDLLSSACVLPRPGLHVSDRCQHVDASGTATLGLGRHK